MSTVRTLEGLRYGFKFLGLSLLVLVVGGLLIGGGAALTTQGLDVSQPTQSAITPAVGGGAVLALVGVLWVYGASLGLLHKFVADSVATGVDLTEPGRDTVDAMTDAEADPDEARTGEGSAVEGQPTAGGTGVGDSAPSAAAGGDTAEAFEQTADTGTADAGSTWDGERGTADAATDPGASTADAEATVDGEPSGRELDRVVSEATEPSAAGGPDPVEGDEYGAGTSEPAGYGSEQADDDVGQVDRYRVKEGPEPDGEVDGEAVEDTGIEDIEDTTDESGDWEPLDEDDL